MVKIAKNKVVNMFKAPKKLKLSLSLPHISSTVIFLLCLFNVSNTLAAQQNNTNKAEDKAKKSVEVTLKARSDHEFLLSGDYYYQGKEIDKNKSAGVIILHDCNSDRLKYSKLAEKISEQGLHVLSIDFRGYGTSIATGFSQLDIKKNATDLISYQNEMALLTSYWADDLLATYTFFRGKVDKSKGIALVAVGCAGSYAVSLAEKMHLSALVLLTPQMSYSDKERYKNLVDIPSYFISSTHHLSSYATVQELFAWNGSSRSKMQIYKGARHDRQLISAKLNLVSDISQWLKDHLRK